MADPHPAPSEPAAGSGPGSAAPAAADAVSIWQLKPWWCQPWSILFSGVLMVVGSWLLLHRLWVSLTVSLAVAAWWALFLVLVPAAWAQQQRSSR